MWPKGKVFVTVTKRVGRRDKDGTEQEDVISEAISHNTEDPSSNIMIPLEIGGRFLLLWE